MACDITVDLLILCTKPWRPPRNTIRSHDSPLIRRNNGALTIIYNNNKNRSVCASSPEEWEPAQMWHLLRFEDSRLGHFQLWGTSSLPTASVSHINHIISWNSLRNVESPLVGWLQLFDPHTVPSICSELTFKSSTMPETFSRLFPEPRWIVRAATVTHSHKQEQNCLQWHATDGRTASHRNHSVIRLVPVSPLQYPIDEWSPAR